MWALSKRSKALLHAGMGLVLLVAFAWCVQVYVRVARAETAYLKAKPMVMSALEWGEDVAAHGLGSPLRALLPSTPIAANVTKLLVTDFSSLVRFTKESTASYIASAEATATGSPAGHNVAAILNSIATQAEAMVWGDGTSISAAGGTPVELPDAASIDGVEPLPPMLNAVATPASLGLLGQSCVIMINNLRAVNWQGTFSLYDLQGTAWLARSEPEPWDAATDMNSVMDTMEPLCAAAASMYVPPGTDATKDVLSTAAIVLIVVAALAGAAIFGGIGFIAYTVVKN